MHKNTTVIADYFNVLGHRQPLRPERDTQRQKLYNAEKVLERWATRLETVGEIEEFIKGCVIKSRPLQSRYGRELARAISVGDGHGARRAYGNSAGIRMPRWSRNTYIVLHEVAHTITIRRHSHRVAGHGREYCAIYLDLVRFILGTQAYEELKKSFTEHKVRWKAKRVVTMSPERKAELANRMREMRASAKEETK